MVRWLVALALVVLAGCGGDEGPIGDVPETELTPGASAPFTTATPVPGSRPPDWLGTRVLPRQPNGLGEIRPTPPELTTRRFTLADTLDPLPGEGFASRIDAVPDDVIARSSWSPRCPVARADLRWVRLAFWGFDHRRHTGELLVNASVAEDMVAVFSRLYAARFPIEEMRITTAAEIDAEPTGDGNNTGSFTCRPLHGSTAWSEHAYGRAVDINPFQNPYVKGDLLIPELASAYVDRSRKAPGMIRPGDAVARAFESIGWDWGGDWRTAKDYMHFSANGR